jgi:carnitine-CoA ligase
MIDAVGHTSNRRMPLPLLVRQRAAQDPDGALIDCVDGPGYGNAAFHSDALRLARGLQELGVGARDCVAVMLPNEPIAHVCWVAISWLRSLEVPINPDFRGNSLRHLLTDSAARVLITDSDCLAQVREVLEGSHLSTVVVLDPVGAADVPGVKLLPMRDVMGGREFEPQVDPRPRDTYSVIYTSGTTGPAKGVVMPWASLHQSALQIFPADDPESGSDDAFYCPWPTFHSSGKIALYYAALTGGRLVQRRRFSVGEFWSDIRRHRCTHTHLIGLASRLLDAPEAADDAANPLRWVLMNPMPSDYRGFEKRFDVRVTTGWGMTEIGFPVSSTAPPNHLTCGRLSPDFEARVVDEDDYDVRDGLPGELVVRTAEPWLLLEGYLGRPEATAAAWRNGWFHTGDVLRRDPDGFYYFVDRVADYLRTRGNNVSSLELEAEVAAHPEVVACACIGVPSAVADSTLPDVATDQDIKLVVQRSPGSSLTDADLLAFLSRRIPGYMVPRVVEFVGELPRTPTGKIRKAALRQNISAPAQGASNE